MPCIEWTRSDSINDAITTNKNVDQCGASPLCKALCERAQWPVSSCTLRMIHARSRLQRTFRRLTGGLIYTLAISRSRGHWTPNSSCDHWSPNYLTMTMDWCPNYMTWAKLKAEVALAEVAVLP